MAITAEDTGLELIYTDDVTGTVITIKKDDDNIDVHQVTPVEHAGGQTWQALKGYLDTKL